jgi:hypothetical protein
VTKADAAKRFNERKSLLMRMGDEDFSVVMGEIDHIQQLLNMPRDASLGMVTGLGEYLACCHRLLAILPKQEASSIVEQVSLSDLTILVACNDTREGLLAQAKQEYGVIL